MSNEGHAARVEAFPTKGTDATLRKVRIKADKQSAIVPGEAFSGTLSSDIQIGSAIRFENGAEASEVKAIEQQGNVWLIETDTSVYMLESGVHTGCEVFKSANGVIEAPATLKEATLDTQNYDHTFGPHHIRINASALKEVLLEVEGIQIFRALKRFMVVAKVGNIHLPFYISSEGTSGKQAGAWYPFFGYTGDWLAKGDVSEGGAMHYHPEISRVQKLLNDNLILPKDFISPTGMFGTGSTGPYGAEPEQVLFNLNDHLSYRNWLLTDEAKNSKKDWLDEQRFVQRMTGYYPNAQRIEPHSEHIYEWIKEVTDQI